jgi:hypothetical protein
MTMRQLLDDRDQPKNNVDNEENDEKESNNEYNIEINDTIKLDNDPGKWPDIIFDKVRIFLVKRGHPYCC